MPKIVHVFKIKIKYLSGFQYSEATEIFYIKFIITLI